MVKETWVQEYGELASDPGPDGQPLPTDALNQEFRELVAMMTTEVWLGPATRTTYRPELGITQRWVKVR